MQIEEGLELFLIQLEADGRSAHTIGQYRRHVLLLAAWAADVGHSGELEEVGHQDVARKAAQKLGHEEVPVVWFDGSDIEAVAYSVADNRLGELASWNEQALAQLLEELRAEDALDGVGYSNEDIDQLLSQLEADLEPAELEDPGPGEPPEDPVSRLGDL